MVMSDAEWSSAHDPDAMLESLRGRASSHDLRLFAAACCRRIWHQLNSECRLAVEAAEDFAHGRADDATRRAHHAAVHAQCIYVHGDSSAEDRFEGFAAEAAISCVYGDGDYPPIPTYAVNCAAGAARAVVEVVYAACELQGESEAACAEHVDEERRWQCDTIRARFDEARGD